MAISMIDEIVSQSENRPGSNGGRDVEAVHLRLGDFAGVDREALLFCYEAACEGTPLQGSRLMIETIPLIVYCPVCEGNKAPPSHYQICCPDCLTPTETIISGREIEIAALEVAS